MSNDIETFSFSPSPTRVNSDDPSLVYIVKMIVFADKLRSRQCRISVGGVEDTYLACAIFIAVEE